MNSIRKQDQAAFPEAPVARLRWRCDPEELPFMTTEEVEPDAGLIGQDRARKALVLGMAINHPGYNIYVSGDAGTGKLSAVRAVAEQLQAPDARPPDQCYVSGFKSPECPRLLELPAGQGAALKEAMQNLIEGLKEDVPKALGSVECQRRKARCLGRYQRREQRLVAQLESRLAPSFGLIWQTLDPAAAPEVAPLIEGRPTPMAELEERVEGGGFNVARFRELHTRQESLEVASAGIFSDMVGLRRQMQEDMRSVEQAVARPVIRKAVAEVEKQFEAPELQRYLQDAEQALNEESERFCPAPSAFLDKDPARPQYEDEEPFHDFQVNLIVDHADTVGRPFVYETSPTFKNLFGAIEPAVEHGGSWRSDFMGIRAGAIHRANGGYLVFRAHEALHDPLVWSTLKRALRHGRAEIQSIDHHTLVPTTPLNPDPVPCTTKVILIGDEELYQHLACDDPAFGRLFKVKSDFDSTLPRQQDTLLRVAGFISHVCREARLRPCDREAVGALTEWSVRMAGRQNRISACLDVLADVTREADYWAEKANASVINEAAVTQALRARQERLDLTAEHIYQMIDEDLLLLTTRGAVVGQINGLSVYELADGTTFGCPIRITAVTSMGNAGIVSIEREADFSDAAHRKGILILSGYLRRAYGQDKPLILSASLCMEQSYDGVAGDSASAAEVFALLSSLADLSLDQGIAVTGSVNQQGQLQPVGGINEKIEVFFDVCRRQGLTGTQGVLVPPQNLDDLMLKQDVVDAVSAGKFHIYPVATIDDGLPVLTGVEPGAANSLVDAQLRRYAEEWYAFQHHRAPANGLPPSARGSDSGLS